MTADEPVWLDPLASAPVPDPGPGPLVVVIAPEGALREPLLHALPAGTRVLVATSREEAVTLLRQPDGTPAITPETRMRLLPGGAMVGAREIRLTALEHDLLHCLLSPAGAVWSFQALSEAVWGTSFVGDGCQVRAVVKRLRRKLLLAGADVCIEAVRGRGLRVVPRPPVASPTSLDCPETAPEELLLGGADRL